MDGLLSDCSCLLADYMASQTIIILPIILCKIICLPIAWPTKRSSNQWHKVNCLLADWMPSRWSLCNQSRNGGSFASRLHGLSCYHSMNSMIVDRLLGDCMAHQLIHLRYNGFACRLNCLSSSAITIQNSHRARSSFSFMRRAALNLYTKFQIPTNSYPNHNNPLITQYSLISPTITCPFMDMRLFENKMIKIINLFISIK